MGSLNPSSRERTVCPTARNHATVSCPCRTAMSVQLAPMPAVGVCPTNRVLANRDERRPNVVLRPPRSCGVSAATRWSKRAPIIPLAVLLFDTGRQDAFTARQHCCTGSLFIRSPAKKCERAPYATRSGSRCSVDRGSSWRFESDEFVLRCVRSVARDLTAARCRRPCERVARSACASHARLSVTEVGHPR
jgi:hypothetical protein